MRRLWFFGLALISSTSCANRQASQVSTPAISQTPAIVKTSDNATNDDSDKPWEGKNAPSAFAAIDLANHAYPISSKPGAITLKDGHVEFYEHKFLGNAWFDLESVHYLDINGDGQN